MKPVTHKILDKFYHWIREEMNKTVLQFMSKEDPIKLKLSNGVEIEPIGYDVAYDIRTGGNVMIAYIDDNIPVILEKW